MACRLCLYSLCISYCSVGFTEAPIMRCHISAGLQPRSPMWAIIFFIIPGII